MNRSRIWKQICIGVIALCFVPAVVNAAISVNVGIPGSYTPFDPCVGVTPGGTWLEDIFYLPPDPIAYSWVLEAFEWQFSGANIYTKDGIDFRPENDRWSFSFGDPLDGGLFIDMYDAYDKHTGDECRHGAHLSASYIRDADDPLLLDWVQVFIASYDKHGVSAGTPIADPFYNDGTDDAPFYFSNLDDPYDFYEGGNLGADLIFGDTPGASHWEVEPFSVSLSLCLFLASVDPLDEYHVILHDGISWGYEGHCVPEPTTLIIWILLGTVCIFCGWQRRKL